MNQTAKQTEFIETTVETATDSPEVVRFFAAYGAATYAMASLHYRLAHLYAVSFEDERMASLPRVKEKLNEGLYGQRTTGKLWGQFSKLHTGELAEAVSWAIKIRNFIAHHHPWWTKRVTGTPEGLTILSEQLDVARSFVQQVCDLVRAKEKAILRARVPGIDIEAQETEWSSLDEPEPLSVRLPDPEEQIVRAWLSLDGDAGPEPWIYLESAAGILWQLNETGLSDSMHRAPGKTWSQIVDIQQHLPAFVVSRPSRKGNPPVWRGAFDYDLRFSTGVALLLELVPTPAGSPGRLTYEMKATK
jgi:hypothetical protein